MKRYSLLFNLHFCDNDMHIFACLIVVCIFVFGEVSVKVFILCVCVCLFVKVFNPLF